MNVPGALSELSGGLDFFCTWPPARAIMCYNASCRRELPSPSGRPDSCHNQRIRTPGTRLIFYHTGRLRKGRKRRIAFLSRSRRGTAFFMAEAGEDQNREEAFQVMSGYIAFAGRLRLDSVLSNVDDRIASFQEAKRRGVGGRNARRARQRKNPVAGAAEARWSRQLRYSPRQCTGHAGAAHTAMPYMQDKGDPFRDPYAHCRCGKVVRCAAAFHFSTTMVAAPEAPKNDSSKRKMDWPWRFCEGRLHEGMCGASGPISMPKGRRKAALGFLHTSVFIFSFSWVGLFFVVNRLTELPF